MLLGKYEGMHEETIASIAIEERTALAEASRGAPAPTESGLRRHEIVAQRGKSRIYQGLAYFVMARISLNPRYELATELSVKDARPSSIVQTVAICRTRSRGPKGGA